MVRVTVDGPPPQVRARIEAAAGLKVRRARPAHGGYTDTERWLVEFEDGARAFAKVGTRPGNAAWIRREYEVYRAVRSRAMPACLGFHEADGLPALLLEDLSGCAAAPPWSRGKVDAVRAALDGFHRLDTAGLAFLPAFEPPPDNWKRVAEDPGPFLSLGLATRAWLDAALPTLVAAGEGLEHRGRALLHFDVRSDNLFFAADGARLFDWNHACRGAPVLDLAFWLPSLRAEGGPAPEDLLPDAPGAAGFVSGFFAARAGLPVIPEAPRVRIVQRSQLATALPWAQRALGLPPLDGPGAPGREAGP